MDTPNAPSKNPWEYATDAVAGIDWSIRSPAICIVPPSNHINNVIVPFEHCHFYWLTNRKGMAFDHDNMHGTYMGDGASYEYLAGWAVECLKSHKCSTTGLEDYAYGSPHIHTLMEIAENTGILKMFLNNNAIDYNLFSPTSIKKFATSNGKATKDQMMEAFDEDNEMCLNIYFGRKQDAKAKSPVSDIVDAYYIALAQRADNNHTNYTYRRNNGEGTQDKSDNTRSGL